MADEESPIPPLADAARTLWVAKVRLDLETTRVAAAREAMDRAQRGYREAQAKYESAQGMVLMAAEREPPA